MSRKRSKPAGRGRSATVRRRRTGTTAAPSAASAPSLSERAARSLEEMRRRTLPFEQALLEDALDLKSTLRTVVAAFVPGFADWCFVDLLDGAGVPRRVVVAHADPTHALVAEEYRAITLGAGWATPGAQAIRDRTPRIYPRLTDELMTWATWDDRHLAALRGTTPNSLMALPLIARGEPVGALTLLRSGSAPPFWGEDLPRAVALAAPSALALAIARAFEGKTRATSPLPHRGRGSEQVEGSTSSPPVDRRRRRP